MTFKTPEEDRPVKGGLDDIPVFDQAGNQITESSSAAGAGAAGVASNNPHDYHPSSIPPVASAASSESAAAAAASGIAYSHPMYEKKSTIVTIPPETTLLADDPNVGEPIGTIPTGTALEHVATPALPARMGGARQIHVCCGCCCDCRRAVMVVNAIGLCLAFVFLILGAMQHANADDIAEDYSGNDEATYNTLLFGLRRQSRAIIITMIVGILFHSMGIMGAIQYNIIMILAALIWYCVDVALSLWTLNLLDAVVSAIFTYPHFVLIREIKLGILTPDNYPDQRHSCCCV